MEPVAVRAYFPPMLPVKSHTLAHCNFSGKHNAAITPFRVLGKKFLGTLEQYRNTLTRQPFNIPVFRSSCHPEPPGLPCLLNVHPLYMIYPLTVPLNTPDGYQFTGYPAFLVKEEHVEPNAGKDSHTITSKMFKIITFKEEK